MATFAVRFFWPRGATADEEAVRRLDAHSFQMAKMQAAMLYATLDFQSGPPCGYQILQDGETEVYVFPEPTAH